MQTADTMASLIIMATHMPIYLVWIAGIIVATKTWKRNPGPSLFAILAITFMLVFDLIDIYMVTLPIRLNGKGYTMVQIGTLSSKVNLVLAILRAGSWGLLLAAIFGGRHSLSTSNSQLSVSK